MSNTIDVVHESDEELPTRDRNNVLTFSKDDKVEQEQQSSNLVQEEPTSVPWRGFLRNSPVRALAYTHFCNNWWVKEKRILKSFEKKKKLKIG